MNLKAIFTTKNIIILVLVVLVALILAALAVHFAADIKVVLIAASGALLVIVLRFGWLVGQKGWGWGLALIHAWWNRGKADFTALQDGLTTLEGRVTTLERTIAPALQQSQRLTLGKAADIQPPPLIISSDKNAAPTTVDGVQQSPNSNG
jgi:hypothetical protein